MAAAASSSSAGKKRQREEKDDWKTHIFKVGERLSYLYEAEHPHTWNEIEVIKVKREVGKPQQIKIRYFGWHFEVLVF